MTIVLLILKIIGVLLLLLIALLLLALFVPIRYRAVGTYHSKLQIKLRVSWLLHLFTFGLDMLPGQNDMYLRIFGIKKILTKADNTAEFEDTIEEIAEDGAVDIAEETEHAAEEFADASVEKEEITVPEEEPDKTPPKKKRGFHPLRRIIQKIKDSYERMKAAVVRILAVITRVRGLASDERNRLAVRFLFDKLFWLIKRVMPKRLHLCVTYSTGSPDTTGEVLGVLALFPIGYKQRWNITPDFTADSFYVEADFDVKGRMFLCQFVWTALSVLLDKNCRRLYNEIKHGS